MEPDACEPVVRVRIAAERLHHVAFEQPYSGGRHQRAKVRKGPLQQPAGDTCRSALLRRVLVPDQKHSRREQRSNHSPGGSPTVQSVAGQVRRGHR